MKIKRTLLTLLCALLISLPLSSCGSADQPVSGSDSEDNTAETSAEASASPKTEFAPDTAVDMISKINVDLTALAAASMQTEYTSAAEGQTERPTITVYKMIDDNLVFFGGKTDPDSEVHITGGVEDMVFLPDDDNFWAAVYIPDEVTTLSVTAVTEGKSPSHPITVTARPEPGNELFESRGVCGVVVGDKFQGHFQGAIDDYIGANLLTDRQRDGVVKATAAKVDAASKVGAQLVYLLIPNPMNIYPETVPAEYERYTGDSLTAQFTEIATECGAKVIDLTDTFLEHRDDEYKLFHKTDSHWSEYGAYFGYRSLCEYFAESFPDAVPRDISLFKFYEKDMYAGDMATHLVIDNRTLRETATVCDLLFDSPWDPDFFMPDKMEVESSVLSGSHNIENSDTSRKLPKVVYYRDSFGAAIEGMLNDTGSASYWSEMWNYNLDSSLVKSLDADYVVYIITERNIKNVMY